MLGKRIATVVLSIMLSCTTAIAVLADSSAMLNATTMENSGAYLFEWRPVDCGNGHYFAILVGGNSIAEKDVILNKGYDYAYTFDVTTYPRPWGQVPDLINVDGVWAIPENQPMLPEGTQNTLQIVLVTNNKKLPQKERYIDVVSLPGNVQASSLPKEVRKYLINVDGSDAGAYNETEATGWKVNKDGTRKYLKPDGTYVSGGWLNVDDNLYYMNDNGIMLSDTITPDGYYVNTKGEKTNYIPGWHQDEKGWRYIQKNGYYAGATWIQGDNGNWYYINIGTYMETDDTTPDGYYVDTNGVWNGEASTIANSVNLGPGMKSSAGWEAVDGTWKYKQEDGTYITNNWKQDDGKWYYFDENSLMVTNQQTPDGYFVNEDGVLVQ